MPLPVFVNGRRRAAQAVDVWSSEKSALLDPTQTCVSCPTCGTILEIAPWASDYEPGLEHSIYRMRPAWLTKASWQLLRHPPETRIGSVAYHQFHSIQDLHERVLGFESWDRPGQKMELVLFSKVVRQSYGLVPGFTEPECFEVMRRVGVRPEAFALYWKESYWSVAIPKKKGPSRGGLPIRFAAIRLRPDDPWNLFLDDPKERTASMGLVPGWQPRVDRRPRRHRATGRPSDRADAGGRGFGEDGRAGVPAEDGAERGAGAGGVFE